MTPVTKKSIVVITWWRSQRRNHHFYDHPGNATDWQTDFSHAL